MIGKNNRLLAIAALASAVCGGMAMSSAPADASPVLTVSNCSPACTVSYATDGTGTVGATVTGNGWALDFGFPGIIGSSYTDTGTSTSPILDLSINGHSAGSLDVFFEDSGFTGSGGIFQTELTQSSSGISSSLVTTALTNHITPLSTIGSTTNTSVTDYATANFTGPYGLTMAVDISGTGTVSIDDTLKEVPEPATFALFGAGLLGVALGMGRRRRSKGV
jgi:hypothetical protein